MSIDKLTTAPKEACIITGGRVTMAKQPARQFSNATDDDTTIKAVASSDKSTDDRPVVKATDFSTGEKQATLAELFQLVGDDDTNFASECFARKMTLSDARIEYIRFLKRKL